MTEQTERQAIVQRAVMRPVQSLRDLKATEVHHVLARINARGGSVSSATGTSAGKMPGSIGYNRTLMPERSTQPHCATFASR